jgi:hypothetical protein
MPDTAVDVPAFHAIVAVIPSVEVTPDKLARTVLLTVAGLGNVTVN